MTTDAAVQFETPENVRVSYRLAGPGTRFVAFLLDEVIVGIASLVLFLAMMVLAALLGVGQTWAAKHLGVEDAKSPEVAMAIMLVIATIAIGFGNLLYFILFEFFSNGQTIGKRAAKIRVVMEKGFTLSFTAVALRGLFRLIDMTPILWIVPMVSKNFRRFGDMVAGTAVVSEEVPETAWVRQSLAQNDPAQAQFTFAAAQLDRLQPDDERSIELLLARRNNLSPAQTQYYADRIVHGLGERLEATLPLSNNDNLRFLADLLSAQVRRQASTVN